MREKIKLKMLLVMSLLGMLLIPESYGFFECPISPVPFPNTPEINNCLQLFAYIQSQGASIEQWCQNPNNQKQCCFTCSNYNTCKNIAYDGDCNEKALLGQCNQLMANSLPVSYFCPKSCGKCSKTLSCSSLSTGCNGGVCYSANYFSQVSITCVCPTSKGGSYCQETNACLKSPCLNNGECTPLYEQESKYTCSCRVGFSGKNCESVVDTCLTKSCLNGGTCLKNQDASPYCKCAQGYAGLSCESYIGACFPNQCLNGGSCIPNRFTPFFYCVCKSDYTGKNCETKLQCTPITCQNNGVCREGLNGGPPTCECKTGFFGSYCQNQINGCTNSPCKNGGTCIAIASTSSTNQYICICPSNNSGNNCEYFNLGCGNTICQNGGTCFLDSIHTPKCKCPLGFVGNNCEKFVGTCNVCLNGGTCIANQYNGINTCICPTGYFGNLCEYAINCDRGDVNIFQCKSWSSYGFCDLKYTYSGTPVPIYCPISCNMCSKQCQDAAKDCPLWANQGLCQSIVSQNNGLCRKSCNQCYNSNMMATIDVKYATANLTATNLVGKPKNQVLNRNETVLN